MPRAAKPRYAGGRFVAVDERGAVFALPNAAHRSRCEEHRAGVEQVLSDHFGRPVPLVLVVDDGATVAATADAGEARRSTSRSRRSSTSTSSRTRRPTSAADVDRIAAAFPGAELVEEEDDV